MCLSTVLKTDYHSSFLISQDREAEPRFSTSGQGGGAGGSMRGGFQGGPPMRGGFGGGYDAMGGGGGGPGMMAGGSRQIYVSNVRLTFLTAPLRY
jgi:hypothetical protein